MIYYNYPSYYSSIANPRKQYPMVAYPNMGYVVPNRKNNTATIKNAKTKKETPKGVSTKQMDRKEKTNENSLNDKPLFEILGIKLYFDDVLLICLIFFLYNEGVQDQYLFITLILLLLS